jgi:hypothetical protein
MSKRKNWLTIKYTNKYGLNCANPECIDGLSPEVHHIIPLKYNGEDSFDNMILLCQKCHRRNKLHSNFEEKSMELYVWKCLQENELNIHINVNKNTSKIKNKPEILDKIEISNKLKIIEEKPFIFVPLSHIPGYDNSGIWSKKSNH